MIAAAGHRPFHVLVLLTLLAPAAATAQALVGMVVEEGTAKPISAAFVVLETEDGERRGGVLTGPDGRFVVRAASAGTYRLVTEMIGYATVRSEPVTLRQGETLERTIEVPVQAISLEGIQVAAGTRCRPRPGSGPETARLWEEARKALEVASWGERSPMVQYLGVRFERVLDPGSLRVVEHTEEAWRGWSERSPFRSISAAELAERGYAQEAADGQILYYAPDADVLLSEVFLDSHCFAVAPPPGDEPDLVGLSFEPVRGGAYAGIRGVLWLDRGTAELRRLDFGYTRIPGLPSGVWDAAGGRIEFERLATGVWIVRRWSLRMPLATELPRAHPAATARTITLSAVHETGAEVRAVRGRDGRLLSEASGATLYGTVTYEQPARPLAGALIEVVASGHAVTAAEDGSFRLTELPAGVFEVEVSHPELDLMGLPPELRTVELTPGRATRLPVAVVASADRADELCRSHGWEPREPSGQPVLLYGRVRDAAGQAAGHAMVHVADPAAGAAFTGAGLRALADAEGVYRLCLDPQDRAEVRAVAGDRIPTSVDWEGEVAALAEPGFVRADLVVRAAAPAAAVAGEPGWQNALLGTVLDQETGQTVAGAMVSLVDGGGGVVRTAVSDQAGRFRITYPGQGTQYRVRVEHVAYGTAEGPVRFDRSEQLRLDVLLSTRAIELEPVVVTERRRGALASAGFYERRTRGTGVFVEMDEARWQRTSSITDLLAGQPSIRVVPVGDFGTDIRIIGTERTGPDGGSRDCQPSIYLDGMLLRRGGEPSVGDRPLSDILSPNATAGVEVFRRASEVPVRYRGVDAACGVVLIWSR